MPNYRRLFEPGGTWFFTVNVLDRKSQLLIDEIVAVRHAIYSIKRKRPFRIEAMVILPDHIHAVWTLPEGDADFPTRWRLIKSNFSRSRAKTERRTAVSERRQERAIWQRRYWEHLIRDDADFARHVDYIHMNPAKHGLVNQVADWPHSSFHRYVKAEILPIDWAGDTAFEEVGYGERG